MLTITTNLPSETKYALTSELEYVKLTLEEGQTSTPFKMGINSMLVTFFSTTYYTNGSKRDIYIYDLRSVIEAEMIRRGVPCLEVIFFSSNSFHGNDAVKMIFVYSLRHVAGIDTEELLSTTFMSANKNFFVTPNSVVPLTLFIDSSKLPLSKMFPVRYHIYVKTDDGVQRVVSRNTNKVYNASTVNDPFYVTIKVDVSEAQDYAIKSLNRYCQVTSIMVTSDKRVATLYVCRNPSREFYYRNNFNAWDFASLHTVTKEKTETKYSTATCNGKKSHYDRHHSISYEEETSALLMSQARALSEMMTSTEVRLVDGTKSPEDCPLVLINDYTSEISNEPGGSNSIKFEWEFADYEGMINIHSGSRIFSEQFNSVFA